MTEKLSSLAYLASIPCQERDKAIESFYQDAAGNALVINKWFMIQALADYDGIIGIHTWYLYIQLDILYIYILDIRYTIYTY